MLITDIAPILAALLLTLFMLIVMARKDGTARGIWRLPALFCLLFFGWSMWAVFAEGPLGFWTEHVRNLWGNQIWFDLLLAIGIGWVLILPRAKAANMKLPFWMLFTLATGCIGFSAMLARLFYLEERS